MDQCRALGSKTMIFKIAILVPFWSHSEKMKEGLEFSYKPISPTEDLFQIVISEGNIAPPPQHGQTPCLPDYIPLVYCVYFTIDNKASI